MPFSRLFLLLSIFPAAVWAQKLPSIQENAVRAPKSVRIDGKAGEWGASFQAFNRATSVYYSLANDDTHLYLVVQSDNPEVTNKIIRGGLTFCVNASNEKKDKGMPAITFPVSETPRLGSAMNEIKSLLGEKAGADKDPYVKKRADSLMYALNRRQIDQLKEIRIAGIAAIRDSLISIYNEDDVKARALFDGQGNYIYELAVPLSYMGIKTGSTGFAYQLRLNGIDMNQIPKESITAIYVKAPGNIQVLGPGGLDYQSLMSATDLWGKYRLAL